MDSAVHWWIRASAALRARRFEDALPYLRDLIGVVDRIDFEYEEWLRAYAEALRALGRDDEAAACSAYLGATEAPVQMSLVDRVGRARRGDSQVLMSIRLGAVYLSRAGFNAVAALWFEAGAMPVHRAIELERGGQDERVAELWKVLIDGEVFDDRPYEQALAKINYGLCLHRLKSGFARSALIEATTAVEEVADGFETQGLRERAFDCYQLLARIGVETLAFENVAEGYVNSIRILRDDGLKLDALRLYEAFAALAGRFDEFHAVAGILREAADFCTRRGLPYADDLRLRCAEAWVKAATEAHESGHPLQIVENAYGSAAEAFVSVRAFRMAAGVYTTLAGLNLKGGERYRRILHRIGENPNDRVKPVPVPDFLKRLPDYEEVWYVDLAEWELEGNPALIAAGVMADRRFPDFVRRHGLLLVLEMIQPGEAMGTDLIVARLQAIRAYPAISALERLFARGDVATQKAVVAALGNFRFKRSFALLTTALYSDEITVRSQAADSIANLYFPHAFDRLRRIYETRDFPDGTDARVAAIKAIGRVNTPEALDFLCDRLREGEAPFLGHVLSALSELSNRDLVPYLSQQLDLIPVKHRPLVEDLLQRLSA